LEPTEKQVASLAEYENYLTSQGILLDPEERRSHIAEAVNEKIKELGGVLVERQELVEEVSNLVEAPTAFVGKFSEEHLKLPTEVLISVMMHHQKYFPVDDGKGGLLPYFIGVRNGDGRHLAVVADGNAQVILARFADAAFSSIRMSSTSWRNICRGWAHCSSRRNWVRCWISPGGLKHLWAN